MRRSHGADVSYVYPAPVDEPNRAIGTASLLALGVNGIVGVGIFFAPSALAAEVGATGSVLVLLAVAAALVPVALCFAILGKRFPVDGGPVAFARDAFGPRTAFAVGWLAYASALFSSAAVVSGLVQATFGAGPKSTAIAVGAALVLAAIVALGVDVSRRAWSTLTALKFAPLVALAFVSVVSTRVAEPAPADAAVFTASGALRAALTACFAFQGFEIIPVIAGQTKRVERAVPRAILGSLLFAAALYAVLQWGFVRSGVPLTSTEPLVDAGARLSGPRFGAVLRAGTSVSALGIAFGMMVTTPRYLSAATSGRLAATDPRGVPRRALFVTAVALVCLLTFARLAELFVLSSLAVVIQYAAVALSLLRLAARRRHGLGPKHYLPAIATLLFSVTLLGSPSATEWRVFAALLVVGVFAYFFAGVRGGRRAHEPPP